MTEITQFLGVMKDQNLSFQSHIMYIKGKVARGIGILYKSRPFFSLETMRMLYNAFVYPYFTYCIKVWGNTCQSCLDPLDKLQKRAIRTIVGTFQKVWPYLAIVSEFKITEHQRNLYLLCANTNVQIPPRSVTFSLFWFLCTKQFYSWISHKTRKSVTCTFETPLSKSVRVTGVSLYNHFKSVWKYHMWRINTI